MVKKGLANRQVNWYSYAGFVLEFVGKRMVKNKKNMVLGLFGIVYACSSANSQSRIPCHSEQSCRALIARLNVEGQQIEERLRAELQRIRELVATVESRMDVLHKIENPPRIPRRRVILGDIETNPPACVIGSPNCTVVHPQTREQAIAHCQSTEVIARLGPNSHLPTILELALGLKRDAVSEVPSPGYPLHVTATDGSDFYHYRHGSTRECNFDVLGSLTEYQVWSSSISTSTSDVYIRNQPLVYWESCYLVGPLPFWPDHPRAPTAIRCAH